MLIAQHIDSVVQIVAGVFLTWMGFRPSTRPSLRTAKIFRVCGPALVVIGTVLLLKSSAAASWTKQLTSDNGASADFPGPPKANETVDTVGDISVKRTSFSYDVPGKDIAMFLSFSTLPENARAMTDAQRVDGTLAYLTSQGSKVLANVQDPTTKVYRLTLRRDEFKTTTQMALRYVGDKVYRVVVSWTDGQADRVLTDRFLASFRVTAPQP